MKPTRLCLFDLDQTLLPIDSDHAWGEFLIRLGWVDADAFRAGNDAFYEAYQVGQLDIHAYVAFVTAPLRRRDAATLESAHARFMREVIVPRIEPAALELVNGHRERGDLLCLVTATNDFVTAPIAAASDRGAPRAHARRYHHRRHRGHAELSRRQGRARRRVAARHGSRLG